MLNFSETAGAGRSIKNRPRMAPARLGGALGVFCWLLAPTLALGQPLALPSEVKAKVGEFAIVKAQAGGEVVRWVLMDTGPSLLPPELLKDSKSAVIFSLREGKFRLLAYSCHGGEPTPPAICTVVVGNAPDVPTPPPPPLPGPVDPFTSKFQMAFLASPESMEVKNVQRNNLIGLYQAMAEHSQKKEIHTTTDLLADLNNTARAMINKDVLVDLRKLISAEVGAVLGKTGNTVLDDATRAKAVTIFSRIAKALEQVK
jgi:hypothetical protein